MTKSHSNNGRNTTKFAHNVSKTGSRNASSAVDRSTTSNHADEAATQIPFPVMLTQTTTASGTIGAPSLMPTDDISRRILRERAQALAMAIEVEDEEASEQFLRFRLGGVERYGIPYTYLQELLHIGNLTRVPCTPPSIAGVVNHRGELLTVVDLKHFFHIEPVSSKEEARIIVIQHGSVRTGILVDEVDGNETYRSSDLSPPLSSEGVSNMEHVLGIHKGSVTMLNIEALLTDPSLMVGKAA